jgi:hypothetical protein
MGNYELLLELTRFEHSVANMKLFFIESVIVCQQCNRALIRSELNYG